VTKLAASDAKNTNTGAISSGSAQRPIGIRSRYLSLKRSSVRMVSVVDLADGSQHARGRGHVDDATVAALHHSGGDGLQAVEAPGEMHREHFVPLGRRHPMQHRRADDAGVVDQNVDAPVQRVHRGDHRVDIRAPGDIAGDADRLGTASPQLGRKGLGAVRGEIDDPDARALAREGPRDGRADALRSAGDCGDLPVELHRASYCGSTAVASSSTTAGLSSRSETKIMLIAG
jgi:hypothetical protein